MNNTATVVALVEGMTEKIFIQKIISPHLAQKNIFMTPILFSKPGEKGGDVKFDRAKNDIGLHLKQRVDTYLTTFFDFYGVGNDWPGYADAKRLRDPREKAACINQATQCKVGELFSEFHPGKRFIPFVAVHEFEALLFSDPRVLAEHLQIEKSRIDAIIAECGNPEAINDSILTAPSKRLATLCDRFKKTTTGIAVAHQIGLSKIREKCPVFADWLTSLECLHV